MLSNIGYFIRYPHYHSHDLDVPHNRHHADPPNSHDDVYDDRNVSNGPNLHHDDPTVLYGNDQIYATGTQDTEQIAPQSVSS